MNKKVYSEEDVLDAIHQDAIADAEKITGKTIDDEKTAGVGFLLHTRKTEALRTMLASRNDTIYSMPNDQYIKIITDFGFEKVYELSFDSSDKTETFYIYFKLPGLLLMFDTYRNGINGSTVYYNWIENADYDGLNDCVTSSGGYYPVDKETERLLEESRLAIVKHKWGTPEYEKANEQDKQLYRQLREQQKFAWIGDHDAREALVLNLTRLERNGKFIAWVRPPFVWALHHQDTNTKDYDFGAITLERMKKLPEYVQNAINLTHPEWERK